MFIEIKIQKEDFDYTKICELVRHESINAGALVSFIGIVREFSDKKNIQSIWLEHYPEMTQKSIHNRILEAKNRFDISAVYLVHRIGELHANDNIVLLVITSEHRNDAFLACQYLMDYLKNEVPIWKKEVTDTSNRWVAHKQSDKDMLNRWK